LPNSNEITSASDIGFDDDILELIRRHSNKPLERLMATTEDGSYEPANGISIAVRDGHEAEHQMNALRDSLKSRGYRAFWSERHHSNGMRDTNEVAVLKTDDPYAMIRLRRSDGANYDVFTDDIIDRLTAWRELCDFDVVGASRDWVALVFSRLPESICAFSEEVYLFCEDAVTQGVGFTQARDRDKIAAARQLCPDPISTKLREDLAQQERSLHERMPNMPFKFPVGLHDEVETGIKLLAAEIKRTNYLFLWWD
jgi:hypothetical protein